MPAAERTNDDHRRFRVGVDVGGTFTDVVLVEETTGEILVAKVATVPADPSEGCIDAIDKAIRHYALRPGQFAFTVHGTTIATNTIIEGKGAKAGLITSEGFRDVLEIAYQTRPKLYDIFYDKAKPLIPRYLCQGVPERIDGDGVVLVPLDEDAVRRVARKLAGEASRRSRSRFSIPTRIRRTSGASARFSPKNCRTCRSSCPPTSARNTASIRAPRRLSSMRCCSRASDPTLRGWRSGSKSARSDPASI